MNFTGFLVHIPGRAFSVFTGADGSFQIDNVPAGTYTIAVEHSTVSLTIPDVVVTDTLVTLPESIEVGTCAPACVPSGPEVCDGIDNNCDGQIDEGVGETWFQDLDGDGFGSSSNTTVACGPPAGYVPNGGDCDDTNLNINPDRPETCDGQDNNCNGQIDEGAVGTTWFRDQDNDNFGNGAITTLACTRPAGFVPNGNDCNDSNSNVNPGAAEVCDSTDNNCNGQINENASCPAVQNGSGACQANACGIGACNTGFGNCDGIVANGCERNLNTAIEHCGACNNTCSFGSFCIQGTCTSVDDQWKQWQ